MGGLYVREPSGFDVRLNPSAHMLEALQQQRAHIGRSFIDRRVGVDKFTIRRR
jgi:hypothetical protein